LAFWRRRARKGRAVCDTTPDGDGVEIFARYRR
jgi:hypothetical protein